MLVLWSLVIYRRCTDTSNASWCTTWIHNGYNLYISGWNICFFHLLPFIRMFVSWLIFFIRCDLYWVNVGVQSFPIIVTMSCGSYFKIFQVNMHSTLYCSETQCYMEAIRPQRSPVIIWTPWTWEAERIMTDVSYFGVWVCACASHFHYIYMYVHCLTLVEFIIKHR